MSNNDNASSKKFEYNQNEETGLLYNSYNTSPQQKWRSTKRLSLSKYLAKDEETGPSESMYNSNRTSSEKWNPEGKLTKFWDKDNKDEETGLNESMYNSNNTSSEKFR